MSGVNERPLTCDGWCNQTGEVSMLDQDGFAYCTPCGLRRRESQPCRKLRPSEVRKLLRGEVLTSY